MNIDLFIVSYRRDFRYLKYALRSIAKFGTGFRSTVLVVPNNDFDEAVKLARETENGITTVVRSGDEWPEKGMLWHMNVIVHSDEWSPTSDIILHVDSDCTFTEPFSPADYMKDGKPILYFQSFKTLGVHAPQILPWQVCTRECLPFEPEFETMRMEPLIYTKATYPLTRKLMTQKTGESVPSYVQKQRNTFPQSWCEHVTLGNVAMKFLPEQYELTTLKQNRGRITS